MFHREGGDGRVAAGVASEGDFRQEKTVWSVQNPESQN